MHKKKYPITPVHFIFFLFITLPVYTYESPKLTVIFVVDQLAYNYFNQIPRTYFKGGLKKFLSEGIVYTNAYIPHGTPATAPGHVGLSTGTTAHYHGIIGNGWINEHGNYISSDHDSFEHAAVFGAAERDEGISAAQIMVDTISDQFVLSSTPERPRSAFALSIKSRSATGSAGKMGKAIWFDQKHDNLFTSSKAYFSSLPTWLIQFNQKQRSFIEKSPFWKSVYPLTHRAYAAHNPKNYHYTRIKKSFLNFQLPHDTTKKNHETFLRTPHANKLLLNLAEACITAHLHKHTKNQMLLWICLSSLDYVGHQYGPQSLETLDMIYHLDRDLSTFMLHVQRTLGKNNTLFVLTADHGIIPIPEYLQDCGFSNAQRIISTDLLNNINIFIQNKYDIENLALYFKTSNLYLNRTIMNTLAESQKTAILADLKSFLMQYPGIKYTWTYEELQNTSYESHEIESYFKNQLYPNRSGDIIIQTLPFTIISKCIDGTSHKTPYELNTHVPLMLYHSSYLIPTTVHNRVVTLQLANTLAEILHIAKPSASTYEILPHIFVDQPGF